MTVEVRLARDADDVAAALRVRYDVFVREQGVPAELETDEHDETADHVVVERDGQVCGAGRLVVETPGFEGSDPRLGPVGHLGRLAVSTQARGAALGVRLVRAIEDRAQELGLRVMVLSAQTYAVVFYERLGYTAYGDEFDDAGLPHRWMRRVLDDTGGSEQTGEGERREG